MMNCTSIPTITVCQLIRLRSREVIQRLKMHTTRPKRLTARLSRVLSADSGEAKEPIRITAMVRSAAAGVRSFSGITRTRGLAVRFQT